MHAFYLAGLANTYVRLASSLPENGSSIAHQARNSYWLTNRFRHQQWTERLAVHRETIQTKGASQRARSWEETFPTIQEVLLSEPLSRVIAHHAAWLEECGRDREFSAIASSALTAHAEARQRCLHLIVFGNGLSVIDAVRLNRLRRTMESYSDQLLANLRPVSEPERFAFDVGDVAYLRSEFATGVWHAQFRDAQTSLASQLLSSKLHSDISWRASCGRLNDRLMQSVLELLPRDAFDSHGVPRSRMQTTLEHIGPETTGKTRGCTSGATDKLAAPLNLLQNVARQRSLPTPEKKRW